MGITRLQILAKPTLVLTLLFGASFFVPVDVVVARGRLCGISWVRCEVVGHRPTFYPAKSLDETTYVIVRGCVPLIGIEPLRVVKISIPDR